MTSLWPRGIYCYFGQAYVCLVLRNYQIEKSHVLWDSGAYAQKKKKRELIILDQQIAQPTKSLI